LQYFRNISALCSIPEWRGNVAWPECIELGIMMIKKAVRVAIPTIAVTLLLGCSQGSAPVQATRDYISIVGSSTVYPFATVVAEEFGRKTSFKTPKIESTGSGGGLKLFCGGIGVNHPDMTNSSRVIKNSEIKNCVNNGVNEIIEVKLGYGGIVLANATDATRYELTRREIFLALAKEVPAPNGDGVVPNPYANWADIRQTLPDTRIEVYGPPPTSGTRDAFVELAMEGGCKTFDTIKELGKDAFKAICHTVREDGGYIEAGENDNLIVQKLAANPDALGIFGFSFLDQNTDKVQGSLIDGVAPEFAAIANGSYPVSRPLFFYVKKAHVGVIPGIEGYLAEFTSDDAWGDEGYLSDKGLIPMQREEREAIAARVTALSPMRVVAQ
jgi:phosphate transport system substrate-binding protein